MQRDQLCVIIGKLEERKAAGESNLVLKFVKGVGTNHFKKHTNGPDHNNLNIYYQNYADSIPNFT